MTWWTTRRTKAAGIVGLLGSLGLGILSFGPLGLDSTASVGSLLYACGSLFLIPSVLAGSARDGSADSHNGRIVAGLLGLSILSYAGSLFSLQIGELAFGSRVLPLAVLSGTAYMAIRIFGTVYGLHLWRHTNSTLVTAGLFVLLLPVVFLVAPLTTGRITAIGIEGPLYLAFLSLGLEQWTDVGQENGVEE